MMRRMAEGGMNDEGSVHRGCGLGDRGIGLVTHLKHGFWKVSAVLFAA